MINRHYLVLWTAVLCLSFGIARSEKSFAKEKELKPDELVAAHLKSIGSPQVLAKVKSRVFTGTTMVHFRLGATGQLTGGQARFVSEGRKLGIVMSFGALEYPGEHFAFNGENVTVGHINPGQKSPLADFINRYGDLMKEGLLGGALSVGWPLLEVQERKPKLKSGNRKIAGRQLHELEYRPAKGLGDIKVKMYFDPETFHHLRTEYGLRISSAMGARTEDAKIMKDVPDTIYQLLEQFDDFREVDGMMLPHHYTIDFSVEGQGRTFLARWTIEASQWMHNGQIDPQFFEAK